MWSPVLGCVCGKGFAYDQGAAETEYDPSLSQVLPLYSAGLNTYVRDELKFESDLPYEVLSGKVHPWNFGKTGNGSGRRRLTRRRQKQPQR